MTKNVTRYSNKVHWFKTSYRFLFHGDRRLPRRPSNRTKNSQLEKNVSSEKKGLRYFFLSSQLFQQILLSMLLKANESWLQVSNFDFRTWTSVNVYLGIYSVANIAMMLLMGKERWWEKDFCRIWNLINRDFLAQFFQKLKVVP